MASESNLWTPSVFLDKAQELQRRLAVWHEVDPTKPIWTPPFLELQEAIRWKFRDIVLKGEHGSKPEPGMQLFPGLVSKENAAEGIDGTAFRNLPTDVDKYLTRWLLRDFFEHLPDAGSGESAKCLRLKVDRILDAPIYCKRQPSNDSERDLLQDTDGESDEGPHSLIEGHPVEPSLLDELVKRADLLTDDVNDNLPNKSRIDNHAVVQLLRVFTNGLTDKRFDRAASVLQNDSLKIDEKLTQIDALLPFPPTASASNLGQLLGVSKQAVMKTAWWIKNRRGEMKNEIGQRRERYRERAKQHEPS